jgi:Bacterial extracellular solute-binding protein
LADGNDRKPVPSWAFSVCGLIPKGAKNVESAKDFLKYLIQPDVLNEYLKTGLGRRVPAMPSIVKGDPWWMADPHRNAYTTQALLRPTLPVFWAYNPAYAHVQNEHVWQTAWAEIMQQEAKPQDAQGLQQGRGDLRQIPGRADLTSDPKRIPYLSRVTFFVGILANRGNPGRQRRSGCPWTSAFAEVTGKHIDIG